MEQGTTNIEPDPGRIKDTGNIKEIQKRNKKCKCDVCPCRMCKTHI